jgi:hypothetical protein
VPVQDYKALKVDETKFFEIVLKVLLRIFVLGVPVAILMLPLIFYKGEPIAMLFANVIGPLLLISLYMVTFYDVVIYAI